MEMYWLNVGRAEVRGGVSWWGWGGGGGVGRAIVRIERVRKKIAREGKEDGLCISWRVCGLCCLDDVLGLEVFKAWPVLGSW